MMVRVFRHHISLYSILLAVSEVSLFIAGGLVLATILPASVAIDIAEVDESILISSLSVAVFVTVCSVGLYNRRATLRGEFQATQWFAVIILVSAVIGVVFYVNWLLLSPVGHFPLSGWAVAVALYILAAFTVRFSFEQIFRNRKVLKKRVLVFGTGDQASRIHEISNSGTAQNLFEVVGFLNAGDSENASLLSPILPEKLRCDRYALADYAVNNDVDEIVVTLRERRRPQGKLGNGLPIWEMMDCKLRGIDVTEFANFWERELGKVDLDSIRPSWIIFSDGFRVSLPKRLTKRAFDLLVSSLFLLFTFPVMLLTSLAIKLDSRGPVFYAQERVGLGGKTFKVLKFRSMRTDAETSGAKWATKNDDRVTRVGRFIRKTRIDEIPQILNVFKGEMSFVGPRPERPVFVQELAVEIPYYKERHRVKPGITGWAQINYPYGASIEDAYHKHTYDLYYLKNIGFFLDVVILLQTVRVVLFGEGAR